MQRSSERLQNRAFDLVAQSIGIHDQSAVVRAGDAAYVDFACIAIDRDFHGDRNIVLCLLITGIGESAPGEYVAIDGAAVRRRPSFPSDHFRSALDHIECARIGQAPQPEFDSVDSCGRRKFVGETLDGENVGYLAGCAKIRGAQGRALQIMHDHADV